MGIKNRDEIDEKYHWDLSSIFADDAAFLAALDAAKAYPAQLEAYQGEISRSAEKLLGYLQLSDEVGIALGKLINYAQRKSDEDTRISKYQDYANQTMALYVAISGAQAWFTPELLALDEAAMARFYDDCPALELYRRALEQLLQRRAHTLSPAEEKLLAAAADLAQQPDNIYSMFSDADLTFPDAVDEAGNTYPVTHASFVPLLYNQNRALRKNAFETFYGVCRQFRNTAAAVLAAQTKTLKFFAQARRYPNTLAAALSNTEVPEAVYTNLIDAVHRSMPSMHRYTALRRRLLGVDALHFYDIYVPMVDDVEMKFTYEEACALILKALAPMGEEYLSIVREGLNGRWIDVYENPGKRSGAYSAGSFGTQPFILLNFQGNLNDVFTLIHEMGHSIHTYLSCHTQPAVYSDYVIFVAEVASTCNEALLMQYLLENTTDRRKRAYLINFFLEEYRTTLYRQTMFAEFELTINRMTERDESLTADALCDIYGRLNADYFGDAITLDDEIRLEWVRIPHFYYNYYVYQYATGFASAVALSKMILGEGAPAVERYMRFLSGGSSQKPVDLLRMAGVDMTTAQPIDDALALFDSLVDELDALMQG